MLPNWFVAYFGRPRTAPPELLARLRAGEKLPCVKCSTMVLPITFVRQRGGCKNCILSLREKLVFPDDVVQAYARKAIEQPSVKRFWQCPGCGGILEKNEATRRAVGWSALQLAHSAVRAKVHRKCIRLPSISWNQTISFQTWEGIRITCPSIRDGCVARTVVRSWL